MQKVMEHSVGVGTRLPGYVMNEINAMADRLGVKTSEMLRRIVLDYLSATAEADVYPLRCQARLAAATLRGQGIGATVTGGRRHWRVVRIQKGGMPDKQTTE